MVHLAELSNDPIGENDPGLTMEINHEGSVALGREGARRPASSASSMPPPARPTARAATRCAPRRARSRRRPPMPAARSWSRRSVRALMDERFTPVFMRNATAYGASPAAALRPGAEQPLRLRPHHRRDPHDLRRLALAADHPYRGHLRGDALRAEAPNARRSRARPSTSAPTARTTASARSPRSWRATFPGCELTVGDVGRRHPQLPRLLRQDPRRACRSSAPAGPPSAARASSRRSSSASGSTARDVRGGALHPAEGAEAPARHRPDRRPPDWTALEPV